MSAAGASAPNPMAHNLALVYAASLLLTVLMAAASVAGVILGPTGLYGGDPTVVPVFVGQDTANLAIGLPILLGTLWLTRRGLLVGLLLLPGALYYVL